MRLLRDAAHIKLAPRDAHACMQRRCLQLIIHSFSMRSLQDEIVSRNDHRQRTLLDQVDTLVVREVSACVRSFLHGRKRRPETKCMYVLASQP